MTGPRRRPGPVVPDDVREELTRAVRRWQQLPVDRAVASAPAVHGLLADLAGEPLPDLGPAVLMDQLRVVVFDVYEQQDQQDQHEGRGAGLVDRLRALRLSWS